MCKYKCANVQMCRCANEKMFKACVSSQTHFFQLSTVNCQLSTVNCQLSTVNCKLSTANCQLSTVSTRKYLRVINIPFTVFCYTNSGEGEIAFNIPAVTGTLQPYINYFFCAQQAIRHIFSACGNK